MSLTSISGIRVGHDTLPSRPTGCTAILLPPGAIAAVDVRGSAPGTRETDLLDPIHTVQEIHGLVLAGGSAYGLDAASGVMRYLEEQGVGYPIGEQVVPIVPAAILYDLDQGDGSIRPDANCGYRAAQAASAEPVQEGCIGAGAGAAVGRWAGIGRTMKGGIGSSYMELENGLQVAALVALNSLGDVIDPQKQQIIAGGYEAEQGLLNFRRTVLGLTAPVETCLSNTTLVVLATNASLSKVECKKLSQMAHDGIARVVFPCHTPLDGDTVFAMATGERVEKDRMMVLGSIACDVVAEAILRAARAATSIPGCPAAADVDPISCSSASF